MIPREPDTVTMIELEWLTYRDPLFVAVSPWRCPCGLIERHVRNGESRFGFCGRCECSAIVVGAA